jgi:toxin-antitoxin system PIN domain toxin
MKLVDINLLVFSVNPDAPQFAVAGQWWRAVLTGDEPVGLPWASVLGFLRICTNPKIFPKALSLEEALAHVNAWLQFPTVRIVHATDAHWETLQRMLRAVNAGGNWVPDAHFAALALEHNAVMYTNDGDFASFPGVQWNNPLAPEPA